MNIIISSESSQDLSKELLEKNHISIIPFQLMVGDKIGKDGVDVFPKDIFEYYDATQKLPHTSALNDVEYETYFAHLLEKADGIIHISLGSKISSSCSSAMRAAEKFDGRVKVIDSASLSTGIGLLVLYACELRDKGLGLEEIYEKVNARVPYVQASFVLEKVNFLYKGGRCSALSYLGANILGIKPQIVLREGRCVSGKKFRGKFKEVVKKYVETTLEEFNNPDHHMIFITYTTAEDEIVNWIEVTLKAKGFKNIYKTVAGGTITCHCGEHTLGILYFNDGDHE